MKELCKWQIVVVLSSNFVQAIILLLKIMVVFQYVPFSIGKSLEGKFPRVRTVQYVDCTSYKLFGVSSSSK